MVESLSLSLSLRVRQRQKAGGVFSAWYVEPLQRCANTIINGMMADAKQLTLLLAAVVLLDQAKAVSLLRRQPLHAVLCAQTRVHGVLPSNV